LDIISNFIIGVFLLGSFIAIPILFSLFVFFSELGGQTFPEQDGEMIIILLVISILFWFLMLLLLVPLMVIRVLDTTLGDGAERSVRSGKGFGLDLWWLILPLLVSLIAVGIIMGREEYDPSWPFFILFTYLLIFQLTGWLLVGIPSQYIELGPTLWPRLPSRLVLVPLGLMLTSFPALLVVVHLDDSPQEDIIILYLEALYVISMLMWLAGSIMLKVNLKRELRYQEWSNDPPEREQEHEERKVDRSGKVKGLRGTLFED